jgi:hypothetical protein
MRKNVEGAKHGIIECTIPAFAASDCALMLVSNQTVPKRFTDTSDGVSLACRILCVGH